MGPVVTEVLVDAPPDPPTTTWGKDVAALICSDEDATGWTGLTAEGCRIVAKRLLELAAEHERKHGTGVRQ